MKDGIHLEDKYQIEVLTGKVAQSAVREAQLEAAVQQLLDENGQGWPEFDPNGVREFLHDESIDDDELKKTHLKPDSSARVRS